jgi:hypothetical protein
MEFSRLTSEETLQQAQWSFGILTDREQSIQGGHCWGQQAACYHKGSPVDSIWRRDELLSSLLS